VRAWTTCSQGRLTGLRHDLAIVCRRRESVNNRCMARNNFNWIQIDSCPMSLRQGRARSPGPRCTPPGPPGAGGDFGVTGGDGPAPAVRQRLPRHPPGGKRRLHQPLRPQPRHALWVPLAEEKQLPNHWELKRSTGLSSGITIAATCRHVARELGAAEPSDSQPWEGWLQPGSTADSHREQSFIDQELTVGVRGHVPACKPADSPHIP
jgi:hypothetical protein